MRRLIEEQRFTTVFQPIWDLERETLLGVEALMRPDPSCGLSGPAEAFDLAEQIGRVRQLDVLCVEEALRRAPEIDPGVLLFLNLSPVTLDLDAEADAWLQPLVEQAGLRPESVVIEVTERFGGRTEAVVKRLRRLREQGFQTALDDVGTGNSGLEMLRKIDAEFVKLDRSIVAAAPTEPGARAVLMAMATFARQTGAFVIAEGIEDGETLAFLRGLDESDLAMERIVQGGQGFGLGYPARELASRAPAMLHDPRPSTTTPSEGEGPAVRSARRHPQHAVQPDRLAVEHPVLDDLAGEPRVLGGHAEALRERDAGSERLTRLIEAVLTHTPRSPSSPGSVPIIAAAAKRSTLKVPIRLIWMIVSNGISGCGPLEPAIFCAQPVPAQQIEMRRPPPTESTLFGRVARIIPFVWSRMVRFRLPGGK